VVDVAIIIVVVDEVVVDEVVVVVAEEVEEEEEVGITMSLMERRKHDFYHVVNIQRRANVRELEIVRLGI